MHTVGREVHVLRAIVFDVDGTLVDSVDLHARCWQEAFARYGRQIAFPDIRSQIGKGGDLLIPYFLPEEENERWGEELDHFRSELFQERYLSQVRPFPRVRELMERIRAEGKKVALASSGKEVEVDHYMDLLGVKDVVDARTTSDDAERSKPHPDIFAAALERVGVEGPGEALIIGDSPFDAEAAGRLTVRCVGVLCGGFPEQELLRAGCMALYRDPADLLDRFEQSPLAADGRREGITAGEPPALA
jgi:HAD superfamily hydrolase (TIGR01509 family)